jgi:hypothetical protein
MFLLVSSVMGWTFPILSTTGDVPDADVVYPSRIDLQRTHFVVLRAQSAVYFTGDQTVSCDSAKGLQCPRQVICRLTSDTRITAQDPVTIFPFHVTNWFGDNVFYCDNWRQMQIFGGENLFFTPISAIAENCSENCTIIRYFFGPQNEKMYAYHVYVSGDLILSSTQSKDFKMVPEISNVTTCEKASKDICSTCPIDFWGIFATVLSAISALAASIRMAFVIRKSCKKKKNWIDDRIRSEELKKPILHLERASNGS